jgi:hypothetical protein
MTSLIPAPGFSPLTASATQLQFYGFPARPTDPSDLAAWTAAMAAYRSDLPPTQPMQVVTSSTPAASPAYTNWGGYIVGNQRAQSNAYVAVKTEFSAPSVSGCSASALVGFWIGLGGTIQTRDNTLVQQGIECGDSAVGGGSALRPFSEFANTQNPVPFCGQTSWTIPAGDHLYQNMSFETSSNQANFYVEDETSGVAHSCSVKGPGGWSYDDNTAEWIGEAPSGTAPKFSSVQFTDAYAETGSGSWVSLGSQSPAETIAGADSSTYCIAPSGISSGDVFSDAFHQATCY